MVKVRLSGEELYQLASHPGLRVASTPFAPGKIYIGRLAFGRGAVPKPLTGYVGQVGKVAAACKGQRGYAFVACLKSKAEEMGIKKKKA
jgi:hypothetical protein